MFEFLTVLLIRVFLGIYSVYPLINTIQIGNIGYPNTFLPSQVTTDSEKMVSEMVFRKLFKYENGELVNDLVDTWSENEDKTQYNIVLKENQKWQDGKTITSDDILYTISRYETLRNDLSIEKLSNKEVQIKLKTPNGILPTILTFGIEPAHLKNQSKIAPIGSTSYRIARVTKEQNNLETVTLISFKPNKLYNKVTMHFYSDENGLATGYKMGEIDVFMSNQEVLWEGLKKSGKAFAGRQYTILFNTNNYKLENPEVRQSLFHALNIEELLKSNFYANASMSEGPISKSPYTKEDFKKSFYTTDVKLTPAQQTAVKDLEVILPNNQDGRQIEPFLKKYWGEQLGINLEFEYMSIEEIFDKADGGNFDVMFIGYENTPDPDRYLFWHSTQDKILNLGHFVDLRADKALEEGRKYFSFDTRKDHYDIFQDVFITKTPGVFLYHPGTNIYVRSKKEFPIPELMYYPTDIVKNL